MSSMTGITSGNTNKRRREDEGEQPVEKAPKTRLTLQESEHQAYLFAHQGNLPAALETINKATDLYGNDMARFLTTRAFLCKTTGALEGFIQDLTMLLNIPNLEPRRILSIKIALAQGFLELIESSQQARPEYFEHCAKHLGDADKLNNNLCDYFSMEQIHKLKSKFMKY